MSVQKSIRVNMTLCFSQEQAAAVYAATKGSKEPVYVSPFVGQLDDQGEDGSNPVRLLGNTSRIATLRADEQRNTSSDQMLIGQPFGFAH
jgi:transaldolase